MTERTTKGTIVFICRIGVYPNKQEMSDICARLSKTHMIRTELVSLNRFAVTAERRRPAPN